MTQHKKNLLEAFRSAGAAPETSAPAPRVEPRSPVAAPPGATDGARAVGLAQPPRWLFAVVGLALAFAFGFLTGRLGRGESVRAGEEPSTAPIEPQPAPRPERRSPASGERSSAPSAQPGPPAAAAPARLEESSLFDKRNTHTVIVATYDRQAEDLALATYKHLLDARLPAFPPVVTGKHLVVLVGAAESYSALESIETAVKALTREGERPYAGAYRVRIDTILSR